MMVASAIFVPGVLGSLPGLANFLVLPWMHEFGASRGFVIFLIEIGSVAMLLSTPIFGRLLLRIAPWMLMLAGVLVAVAGLLLTSAAPVLGVAAAGFILMNSLGMGACSPLAAQTVVVRRRPHLLGKVSGAQTVASALTGVAIPLIVAPQITAHGWRAAVIGCALFILAVMPAAILLFLRLPPLVDHPTGGDAGDGRSSDAATAPKTLEILAMPAFWMLAAAIVPVAIVAQSLSVNIIPFYAERGVDAQHAAYVLAGIGASAAVGALLVGAIVDRVPPAVVMSVIAAVAALGLAALALRIGPPAVPLVTMFVGLAGVAPTLYVGVRRLFGSVAFPAIAGLVGPFLLLSAFSGAGAGWLRDHLGSYEAVFGILSGLMVLSLLGSLLLLRRPLAEP